MGSIKLIYTPSCNQASGRGQAAGRTRFCSFVLLRYSKSLSTEIARPLDFNEFDFQLLLSKLLSAVGLEH
jgi:hypothetical protein